VVQKRSLPSEWVHGKEILSIMKRKKGEETSSTRGEEERRKKNKKPRGIEKGTLSQEENAGHAYYHKESSARPDVGLMETTRKTEKKGSPRRAERAVGKEEVSIGARSARSEKVKGKRQNQKYARKRSS